MGLCKGGLGTIASPSLCTPFGSEIQCLGENYQTLEVLFRAVWFWALKKEKKDS